MGKYRVLILISGYTLRVLWGLGFTGGGGVLIGVYFKATIEFL